MKIASGVQHSNLIFLYTTLHWNLLQNRCYLTSSLPIHLLMGTLGCFHVLAVANDGAVNLYFMRLLTISIFKMPSSTQPETRVSLWGIISYCHLFSLLQSNSGKQLPLATLWKHFNPSSLGRNFHGETLFLPLSTFSPVNWKRKKEKHNQKVENHILIGRHSGDFKPGTHHLR